ncbi:unnamed protein product [Soboliphyme baturini]|uniref:ATG17_like domain-containing protein n=1 Tax=Soboliphyme baturini TaxID=241478 RepID=A0A183J0D7_9BILA|nr:unnamed protein product [Soboliphyme baturini]
MLHVFHLDGGRMHNFDVSLSTETVLALQTEFSKVTRVPVAEQILLVSGGEILLSKRPLSSYTGAGTESNPIFLIAKSAVVTPSSDASSLTQSDYKDELHQLLKNAEEVEKEVEQWIGRAPSFTFLQCFASTAKKIERSCQELVSACSQMVNEQHLLHQGWCSVVANLEDTFAAFFQHVERFRHKHIKSLQYRREARNILIHFDDDIQLLKKVPLLPCLVNSIDLASSSSASVSLSSSSIAVPPRAHLPGQPLTLFDWISSKESEHSLLEFADDVRSVIDEDSDSQVIGCIERWHEYIKERAGAVDMKEIRGLGQRLVSLNEFLQSILKTKDAQSEYREYVTKQEQRVMSCGDKTVLDDVCSSVTQALHEMSMNQKRILDFLKRFYKAKLELLESIRRRLAWVLDTHKEIQIVDTKIMLYSERVYKLRRQFELLKQLHEASALYMMAAGEVVRRRNFSQEYTSWATRLMQAATQVREEELQRRKWFGRRLQRHFLKSLFPGIK